MLCSQYYPKEQKVILQTGMMHKYQKQSVWNFQFIEMCLNIKMNKFYKFFSDFVEWLCNKLLRRYPTSGRELDVFSFSYTPHQFTDSASYFQVTYMIIINLKKFNNAKKNSFH